MKFNLILLYYVLQFVVSFCPWRLKPDSHKKQLNLLWKTGTKENIWPNTHNKWYMHNKKQ